MLNMLKELCNLNGTSGDEKDVRDYIISKIKNINCEIKIDNMGNLIVFKKGCKTPKNKVMLCAHMDEVGFIAGYITKEGYIKIKPVGGIMPGAVLGRHIYFKSGIIGVAGSKPVHKLKGDEKEKQPEIEDLHVDIGAKDREDALKYISLGENGYFINSQIKTINSDFERYEAASGPTISEMGGGLISGKAIDDRIGCAVLIDLILNEQKYDAYYVFTVSEEVGTRGAAAAVYSIMPDMAIVLEATTAADIPGVENGDVVCKLGDGTVVSYMDGGAIYDKELYDTAFFTARENNLKCQTKTKIAGGNDGAIIHKTLGGVRTIALSVPCRYLHTAHNVIKKSDADEMRILAEKLFEKAAIL